MDLNLSANPIVYNVVLIRGSRLLNLLIKMINIIATVVYLVNYPVGSERDSTRRLSSNSQLVLSDVESLADSLRGEVLGPALGSEGGGLDVSLSSVPHSLTLRWGVEISEHPHVRVRAEKLVFERSESEVVVLVVQMMTLVTIVSPPRQLLPCTEIPGGVVTVVPHAVESFAQELQLCGPLPGLNVLP